MRYILLSFISACQFLTGSCATAPDINEVQAPEHADEATVLALESISLHLGVKTSDIEPDITWADQECFVLDSVGNRVPCDDGFRWEGFPVGEQCEVYLRIWPKLWKSSLAHELMHCVLDARFGDPDGAHARPGVWEDEGRSGIPGVVDEVQLDLKFWEEDL